MTDLRRSPVVLTQHALCALNLPISSADTEADSALNS